MLLSLLDQPVINDVTSLAYSFEINLIVADLYHHEVIVVIEARCTKGALFVDSGSFSRSARNKVLDTFLRDGPFVNVVVSGECDIHVVSGKQRLKLFSQTHRRAVMLARRVDWMMKDGDFPLCL